MDSKWNEREAAEQTELDGLLYASHLIGADQSLVLWGGGNTSAKLRERDYRGRDVDVLRVKGSGSDLRTIKLKDFPGVRLEDALALLVRDAMTDEAMVAYLAHTLMEPTSPRPSIETLLHAFLPARFVIHSHADAILGLTNTPQGQRWTLEVLGQGTLWITYQRPGFALSRQVAQTYQAAQAALGAGGATSAVLAKHGLITWGDTARQAYERHIEVVARAEDFLAARRAEMAGGSAGLARPTLDHEARRRVYVAIAPLLRGLAGRTTTGGTVLPPGQTLEVPPAGRVLLKFDDSADFLEFACNPAAERLAQIGPATPDHLINIKRTALYVPAPEAVTATSAEAAVTALTAALELAWTAWVADYARYVRDGANERTPAPPANLVDGRPRVIVIPGLGVVTLGRDARAAQVSNDIYHHAVRTIRDAEGLEAYVSLSPADCYDVEFWPMELYKLTLAPPEAELSRKVVLVTGAASGIGKAIAERFAQDGAHVVVSDINAAGAKALAAAMIARHGLGRATAVGTDVTSEADMAATYESTVLAYGGLDVLVSNAGIAPFSAIDATSLADWQRSLDVNSTGHFLAIREALRLFKRQGLGGNVVFISTKNTMAPGKEFGAYSAAKSAQAQLARVAALEGGDFGIRVNMVNPDAVFRGSTLWSPELRRARAQAHGVSETDLGDFYRKRCLLGVPIFPEDVAEAAWWLATERSRKTTGGVITVDGGVAGAFPR